MLTIVFGGYSLVLYILVMTNELHLEGYNIECNKNVITKVIRYP
jgi:hypothetical protein